MLTLAQVVELFETNFTRSAFRLEALDFYDVDSDGDDYHRYVAGEPDPDPDRKNPWLAELRAEKAAGRLRHRVHVLRTPLNDYLRYECEWGYVPNSEAGEDIRILDLAEVDRPAELIDGEWWILDEEIVLRMIYDDGGKFLGAERVDDVAPYLRARDAAIAASTPFPEWWNRHPEEWRTTRGAKLAS